MPLRFTLSEASVITGLPVKAINKAIEKKTVPAQLAKAGNDRPTRLLDRASLVCLSLEAKGLENFLPKIRRTVYRRVLGNPRAAQLRQGEAVIIDIATARREVTSRM